MSEPGGLGRLVAEEGLRLLRGRIMQVLYSERERRIAGRPYRHSVATIAGVLRSAGFDYTDGQVRRQLGALECWGYVESERVDRGALFGRDTEIYGLSRLGGRLHDGEIAADGRVRFDRPDQES